MAWIMEIKFAAISPMKKLPRTGRRDTL